MDYQGFDTEWQRLRSITTHTLEAPRTWMAKQRIDSSLLQPGVYDVEFITREMVERPGIEIAMRIRSLYAYARFDGEQLTDSQSLVKTTFEYYPEGAVNTLKQKLCRARTELNQVVRKWSYKLTRRRHSVGLPRMPKFLKPKLSTREIVTREDTQIRIERVQESLFAQIALFHKYNLKPQAVLAHPEMASKLAAARAMDGRPYQIAATQRGGASFAGLPVIACSEIAQGAMIV